VRAAEQPAHGAPLFLAGEQQFFQATMRPPLIFEELFF